MRRAIAAAAGAAGVATVAAVGVDTTEVDVAVNVHASTGTAVTAISAIAGHVVRMVPGVTTPPTVAAVSTVAVDTANGDDISRYDVDVTRVAGIAAIATIAAVGSTVAAIATITAEAADLCDCDVVPSADVHFTVNTTGAASITTPAAFAHTTGGTAGATITTVTGMACDQQSLNVVSGVHTDLIAASSVTGSSAVSAVTRMSVGSATLPTVAALTALGDNRAGVNVTALCDKSNRSGHAAAATVTTAGCGSACCASVSSVAAIAAVTAGADSRAAYANAATTADQHYV